MSFQGPWERRVECATSPPGAWTAARSCAVGGATTPCASSASPSVNASSSGAAQWSATTARRWWTFTPASLTRDPIGWMSLNQEGLTNQSGHKLTDLCSEIKLPSRDLLVTGVALKVIPLTDPRLSFIEPETLRENWKHPVTNSETPDGAVADLSRSIDSHMDQM